MSLSAHYLTDIFSLVGRKVAAMAEGKQAAIARKECGLTCAGRNFLLTTPLLFHYALCPEAELTVPLVEGRTGRWYITQHVR